ncbi:nuclear transport factor 2 family protein [Kistimonas scapharcae]
MLKQVVIALVLLASGALQAGEYPKPQTPSELHALFGSYFVMGDLAGIGSLFDENAVFVVDEQGSLLEGREAIVQEIKHYMDTGTALETVSASIHINGDTALIKSIWKISGSEVTGTALEVMIYKEGGWLYWIDNPNGF